MTMKEKLLQHLWKYLNASSDKEAIDHLYTHIGKVEVMTEEQVLVHQNKFTSIIMKFNRNLPKLTKELRSYIASLPDK